ncbi:immunity 53 family protein [Massilia sp. DWR3-1-1]|uniref:immunity 53 family protein n=1 Tax=Massilia sp. DWR3-1-1 TaxID=2804559 RepID=UPI003CEF3E6A
MSALVGLQNWYASQCDGDWEHSFGIQIETLDNPGWWLEIDLSDTDALRHEFDPVQRGDALQDARWIDCRVEKGKFIATGGAHCLEEMAMVFLTWVADQC